LRQPNVSLADIATPSTAARVLTGDLFTPFLVYVNFNFFDLVGRALAGYASRPAFCTLFALAGFETPSCIVYNELPVPNEWPGE
jgi:hypothetical protein